MRISSNKPQYDSVVNKSSNTYSSKPIGTIKRFLEAFRIDFSQRALSSKEFNDPSIKFPTHNSDVLQYSSNLSLTYK